MDDDDDEEGREDVGVGIGELRAEEEPRELDCALWFELVRWRWWWLPEELREDVEPEASGRA